MIIQRISKLGIIQERLFSPFVIMAHTKLCPAATKKVSPESPPTRPICPPPSSSKCGGGSKKSTSGEGGNRLVRAIHSGKCRLGFIPEEWFLFFSTKTGVSGPYFLMLGLTNYVASKEIFVMEHEYYSGLSILLVLYLVTTKFGAQIGAALDKQVDEIHDYFQKDRDEDIAYFENVIKEAKLAQLQAQGQKELMIAKKENIALQLEAAYRERVMKVYKTVRGRMEYHVRRDRTELLIHHRWMVEWVIKKVRESITPEFQKKALQSAISELASIANRAK